MEQQSSDQQGSKGGNWSSARGRGLIGGSEFDTCGVTSDSVEQQCLSERTDDQ